MLPEKKAIKRFVDGVIIPPNPMLLSQGRTNLCSFQASTSRNWTLQYQTLLQSLLSAVPTAQTEAYGVITEQEK